MVAVLGRSAMALAMALMTALSFGLNVGAAWANDGPKGGLVTQGNTTFRLWGITVPGADQVCEDGWPAGQSAEEALTRLTKGQSVVCDPKGDSQDKPRAAVCKAGGKDLAEEMVRAGMAWARLSDGTTYVVPEADALSMLLGVHGHTCRVVRQQTGMYRGP
jgi:endonuclease YncB( thermonuclease family)